MKAKLTIPAGLLGPERTIEAEGTPEELAKFFREYAGPAPSGTLGSIQFTSAPVSVPTPFFDVCTDGGAHEYPSPWFGVNPAPCKKCGASSGPVLPFISAFTVSPLGELASPLTVHTSTTTSGVGRA